MALQLTMGILEAADVAPHPVLARAASITQSRSVRVYKQRLCEQGLGGLFGRSILGRPAISTQTLVEKAVIHAIMSAVIEEQTLPDDTALGERVNQALTETQVLEIGDMTASMVETIRLRWGTQRRVIAQQL